MPEFSIATPLATPLASQLADETACAEPRGGAPARPMVAAEFRLDETSLPGEDGESIIRSSAGLGWSSVFAAVAREQTRLCLRGAVPAVWLMMPMETVTFSRWRHGGESRLVAQAGTVSILASGESVQDEIQTEHDALHVFVRQQVLDQVASGLGEAAIGSRRLLSQFGVDDAGLQFFMRAILAALDAEGPSTSTVDYIARATAIHLLERYAGGGPAIPAPRRLEALSAKQLALISRYVASHLDKSLTIEELAAAVGVGRAQFMRRFKAATSVTPHTFVKLRRIGRAKALLADRTLDVRFISAACGFASQAHFTLAFRRNVGVTPGAYRRENAQ